MTPAQDERAATPVGPDPVVDRVVWARLRRAAYRGLLQPEGAALVDVLHDLYPAWREEW
ncbi:hypothetical protein [Streptacidiphilus melanogenes]|uniref:hypothetical protein n=1 Tax=Streptacidiphilus melanogenes TaxID=411235 RepID=UPI000AF8D89F|nr:hypothetical protein [Streptacidiphilus melanogenes]